MPNPDAAVDEGSVSPHSCVFENYIGIDSSCEDERSS